MFILARLSSIYERLTRLPLLGPPLQWLRPKIHLLAERLIAIKPVRVTNKELRAELDSQRQLISAYGYALEGLRDNVRHKAETLSSHAETLAAHLQRVVNIEQQLNTDRDALLARITTLESYLTGTAGNTGIWTQLEQLAERNEAARAEVLYEVRRLAAKIPATGIQAGDQQPVQATKAPSQPRILNPAKLAAHQDQARINLGCGTLIDPDRLNIDARELPGVDILADVAKLPFTPGSVAEIHAAHLLEHFTELDLRERLLPYWRGLLRPGGQLIAVVPDAVAMLEAYQIDQFSFEDLRLITFGGQDYDGDFHFTMFSPESLSRLLRASGFAEPDILARARRNGQCLEMEIRAAAPSP